MGRKFPILILFLFVFSARSTMVVAQDDSAAEPPVSDPESDPASDEAMPDKEDGASLQALERRLTEQEQEIEALKESHTQEIEALTERLDAAEDAELDALGDQEGEFEPVLNIYGFFDLSLYRYLVFEDNPIYGVIPDKLSFVLSNLNVYLASQMTESLSALVELRFSFMPHGSDSDLVEFERVDTTVMEPHSSNEFQLGGVVIERVHLTWQPYDAFGITAGRFLTPFGIWNVDHGSPVLLPVQPPYMITREFIPLAQTGIQVHGRFFPTESFFIDYAVTASNGRGPTETAYDLEDDKAIGLKLKLTYHGEKVTVALGGYGFYGRTTDVTKAMDLSDPDVVFSMNVDTISEYREFAGSTDFLFELYGVRLQAEYVRTLVQYETRPVRMMPVFNIPDPSGELQPDYIKWNGYILLAWQLPLDALIGQMRLTPYVMFEKSVMDDTYRDLDSVMFRGGINFKPNSFVVLKLDAVHVNFPESEILTVPWWILNGQLAVSF